jgi:hypothetical protein
MSDFQVEVELVGFNAESDEIRVVTLDEGKTVLLSTEDMLEEVFKMGQNDFQPQIDKRSVSVGDVIRLGDKDSPSGQRRFSVTAFGFKEIK